MNQMLSFALTVVLILFFLPGLSQEKEIETNFGKDSVLVPADQAVLFITPKKKLLTTHFEWEAGAGKVYKNDHSDLSFSGTVKGLYMLTGALYLNMGLGVSLLNSSPVQEPSGPVMNHKAFLINFPVGIGFTIGDDRAQLFNSLDFFPVYYADYPDVRQRRRFSYGVGADLGFHFLIRKKLHLGMMGKVQLFQSFDKEENDSFPRLGFAGAGLLLRYD